MFVAFTIVTWKALGSKDVPSLTFGQGARLSVFPMLAFFLVVIVWETAHILLFGAN